MTELLQMPRGTRDILPVEIRLWQFIEETVVRIFELYNYSEIRTPIFEHTDLFTQSLGHTSDIVEKEMYTFNDRKGRSLTLRPEGTASVVRSYLEHSIHKNEALTKVYYRGPMFRYERPQAGRFRQFHQIGVECLGSRNPILDAEMIGLGVHLFDEIGLTELKVMLNSVGCNICRPVIREQLREFIGDNLKHLCEDCNRRFTNNPLRILDCKKPTCQKYTMGIPMFSICQDCGDHFNAVQEYLDAMNITFVVDNHLVRGLEYYTKTTFEIVSPDLGAQNAICGGGRYDKLVQMMGGPDIPAVGFAFGLERAAMLLQQLGIQGKNPPALTLYVAPQGHLATLQGMELLDDFRRANLRADIDVSGRSLKNQLKAANKLGAEYVLIIGEDEAEQKVGLLKNMANGQQQTLAFSDVLNHFFLGTETVQPIQPNQLVLRGMEEVL